MHDQLMPRGLSDTVFADAPDRSPAPQSQCLPTLPEISPDLKAALSALLVRWDQQIKRRMGSAQQEKADQGRRFIEHGAVCIFNCAMELRQALEGQIGQVPSGLGLEAVQRRID